MPLARSPKKPTRPSPGAAISKQVAYFREWSKDPKTIKNAEYLRGHRRAVEALTYDVNRLRKKSNKTPAEEERLNYLQEELQSLEKEAPSPGHLFFEKIASDKHHQPVQVPNKDMIERALLSIHYRNKPLIRELSPIERKKVMESVRLFWNPSIEKRMTGIRSLINVALEERMSRKFIPLVSPLILSKNKKISTFAIQELGRYLRQINKEDSKPGTRTTFTHPIDPALETLHASLGRLRSNPELRLEIVDVLYGLKDPFMSIGTLSQHLVAERDPKVVQAVSRYLLELCGPIGRNNVLTAARKNPSRIVREQLATILKETTKA